MYQRPEVADADEHRRETCVVPVLAAQRGFVFLAPYTQHRKDHRSEEDSDDFQPLTPVPEEEDVDSSQNERNGP